MSNTTKIKKIGIPTASVPAWLYITEIIGEVLNLKVETPDYLVKKGKDYIINFNEKTVIVNILDTDWCQHSNLILNNLKRMKEKNVDALIIPTIKTDRYTPCPATNILPAVIKHTNPGLNILNPIYYSDNSKKNKKQVEEVSKQIGATATQLASILSKAEEYLNPAPTGTFQASVNKADFDKGKTRLALIACGLEKKLFSLIQETYDVSIRTLRDICEFHNIETIEGPPNEQFYYNIEDIINKLRILKKRDIIDGFILSRDYNCATKRDFDKILRAHQEDIGPFTYITMTPTDVEMGYKEKKLTGQNNLRLESYLEMLSNLFSK